jgi:hypothetical protein
MVIILVIMELNDLMTLNFEEMKIVVLLIDKIIKIYLIENLMMIVEPIKIDLNYLY